MLDILYRDDCLVAIDKPAGLLVHRSDIDRHETRFAVQLLRDQIGRRVHPLHRLDKGTSGVLLFALDEVKAQSGGRGVILMGLDKNESLVAVTVSDGSRVTIEGTGRAGKPLTCRVSGDDLAKHRLHRARKGCLLSAKIKPSTVS